MPDPKICRILFLQSTSEIGGTDITLLRAVSMLNRGKFEPHVILPHEGPLVQAFRQAGCRIHMVPLMKKLTSRMGPAYFFQYAAGYVPAVLQIAEIAKREKIDILHTNTIHNWYGFSAAKIAGKKHLWHVREIVVQSRLVRAFEAFLVKHFSDRFIVMDDAIAAALVPHGTKRPGHMVKLYDGVDLEAFHPGVSGQRIRSELGISPDAAVVGTVCRLDPWKGLDLFLEAAAKVRAEFPDTEFIICGGKIIGHENYEDALRAKAKALGLDRVHFTGWKYRNADIPEVYGAMNISVQCPVFPEPYGLANVEAMACAVPVVACAEGGPLEICHHEETALLVRPRDAAAAAEAVITLLRNPQRARAMGMAGRARAEKWFDLKACVRDLEKIYDEMGNGTEK